MDSKCANDNCKALTRQSDAQAIACTKQQQAREDIGDDKCKSAAPLCTELVIHLF